MALFMVFTRVFLALMLYLASTSSLAQTEQNLQVNSGIINTTYWGNPNPYRPDPRRPSFLSNVLQGLDVARRIVGHAVLLVEVVTGTPSIRPSSLVGDFTSIQLLVLLEPEAELACISSRQAWGSWEGGFRYRRRISPEQVVAIPIWQIQDYDQWQAFRAIPANLGPWLIVFLRIGIVLRQSVLIWYFGNSETDICVVAWRDRDHSWHLQAEHISVCLSYGLPANVSVSQTFLLDDANTNLSSSSNLLPSTAGTNATQVASPLQKLDGFNETEGDDELLATN